MSRVFLMKWYHFNVEYFEDLRNVNHCEFLIMRKEPDNGKYILENKLRTWSELRRERAIANKEKEAKDKKDGHPPALEKSKSFVPTRRWGGCPNGCNHQSHYSRRDDLEALRHKDEVASAVAVGLPAPGTNGGSTIHYPKSKSHSNSPSVSSLASRRPEGRPFQGYNSDDDPSHDETDASLPQPRAPPHIDVTRACEDVVSSPDGTPSFISAEDRLRGLRSPQMMHVGRDGGGTYSGHASVANSDAEDHSEDEVHGLGGSARHSQDRVASLAAQLQKIPLSNGGQSDSQSNGQSNGHTNGHSNGYSNGHSNGNGVHTNGNGQLVAPSENGVAKPPRDSQTDEYGMRPGSHANKLGDVHSSDACSDCGTLPEDDDLAKAEARDKSLRGSVY